MIELVRSGQENIRLLSSNTDLSLRHNTTQYNSNISRKLKPRRYNTTSITSTTIIIFSFYLQSKATPVKEIVIVGDGMCGKTSTISVYLGNRFPTDYIPTVYENYTSNVTHEGRSISLRLWDTAVQEDFEIFRPMLYRKASVFVVMYSVDRPESLANVFEKWVPEVRQYCPDVPIILVGNKTDLRYNSSVVGQLSENDERPVTSSEGREIARKIKAKAFRECSAMTGHGVNEVFKAALAATEHKKRKPSWKWFTDTIDKRKIRVICEESDRLSTLH